MTSKFIYEEPSDYLASICRDVRSRAERGDPFAQYSMGLLYHNGAGVEQDHREAAGWWSKAAASGNFSAKGMLGIMVASNAVSRDILIESAQIVEAQNLKARALHQWLCREDSKKNKTIPELREVSVDETLQILVDGNRSDQVIVTTSRNVDIWNDFLQSVYDAGKTLLAIGVDENVPFRAYRRLEA